MKPKHKNNQKGIGVIKYHTEKGQSIHTQKSDHQKYKMNQDGPH